MPEPFEVRRKKEKVAPFALYLLTFTFCLSPFAFDLFT